APRHLHHLPRRAPTLSAGTDAGRNRWWLCRAPPDAASHYVRRRERCPDRADLQRDPSRIGAAVRRRLYDCTRHPSRRVRGHGAGYESDWDTTLAGSGPRAGLPANRRRVATERAYGRGLGSLDRAPTFRWVVRAEHPPLWRGYAGQSVYARVRAHRDCR